MGQDYESDEEDYGEYAEGGDINWGNSDDENGDWNNGDWTNGNWDGWEVNSDDESY